MYFFLLFLNSFICGILTILLFIDFPGLNHNETSWKCYANEPTGSLSSLFSLLSCQIMMSSLVPYRHQTAPLKRRFPTQEHEKLTFSSTSNPHLGNVGKDVGLCSPEGDPDGDTYIRMEAYLLKNSDWSVSLISSIMHRYEIHVCGCQVIRRILGSNGANIRDISVEKNDYLQKNWGRRQRHVQTGWSLCRENIPTVLHQ